MRAWASRLAAGGRSGRTPILLIGVLVLLPAALLVALGVLTLVQDARLADAQARERLDGAAARAAQDLERGLGLWDRAGAELGAEPPAAALHVPPLIAGVLDGSPDTVLIRVDSGRQEVVPAGRLLYTLEARSPSLFGAAQPPTAFQAGEVLEIQKQDYPRAAEV